MQSMQQPRGVWGHDFLGFETTYLRLILRPFQCLLRQDAIAIFAVVFST